MGDAQTILVIFLSTALAVFLVLAIILVVFLIDIVQRARRIADKAERAAEKAESAAAMFTKAAVPATFVRTASAILKKFAKKSSK